MDDYIFWPFLIPITAIIMGITYAIVKTVSHARVRELEVKERIAMIERGLVPSPEANPHGFERAMKVVGRVDQLQYEHELLRRGPERHRSAAVTLIGVGFGLMLLIGMTDDDLRAAIGVGGFLVIMGLAFLVNSLLSRKSVGRDVNTFPLPPSSPPPPPAGPGQPPSGA